MATLEVKIKYLPVTSKVGLACCFLAAPFWLLIPVLFTLISCWNTGMLPTYSYLVPPLLIVGSWLIWVFVDDQLIISRQGVRFPRGMTLGLFGRTGRGWYDLRGVELEPPSGPSADEPAVATSLSSGTPEVWEPERPPGGQAALSGCFVPVVEDRRRVAAWTNHLVPGRRPRERTLVLRFGSGGHARINLRKLDVSQVEQLIMAIETFCPKIGGLNAIEQVKQDLIDHLNASGIKSYTNLWEDELRYRYASTVFIPLPPGHKLQEGTIKVVRQLGFGGLSAIYLVQRGRRDLCVLKEAVLPGDLEPGMEEKAAELFDREALLLSRLNHPNIARVLDHFAEAGRRYLLLDYVHGQDLRQLVRERGPLPEQEVIEYARCIADILEYLHSQSPPIIHRDLTPENLVRDDNGRLVLIDFGAADEFLQTATGTLVGKHSYIAPEQFRGKASTASDWYSLGATLHFLLTGQDPTALSASRPGAIVPSLCPEMDSLVEGLTSLRVDDRLKSVGEVRSALNMIPAGRVN